MKDQYFKGKLREKEQIIENLKNQLFEKNNMKDLDQLRSHMQEKDQDFKGKFREKEHL